MSELRKILFEAYKDYGDKRIKNPDKVQKFVVDYRRDIDLGNDGYPRPNFCAITVEVPSDTEVEVSMRGNIPLSPSVHQWIETRGFKLRNQLGHYLRFTIHPGEQRMLDDLAARIKAIVTPDLPDKTYYYVCPQTESCLILLREQLDKAWGASS